jgi:hypothetical protein
MLQEAWDTHFVGRQHDSFGGGADGYQLSNVAHPGWSGESTGDPKESVQGTAPPLTPSKPEGNAPESSSSSSSSNSSSSSTSS